METIIENSNTIYIDSGKPGPHVLISAGVHGDEYEPMLAAAGLTGIIPSLLLLGSVRIVTVVNVTAYQANTRYGDDGLDLARICPGRPDGSRSEIAASNISNLIKQADYYVDMHTGGKLFNIYPLAGYVLHPVKEVLKKQQDLAKAFNMPVIWGTECSPNGRTLSVARDFNIPAIYIEYGGGNSVKKEIIDVLKKGCLTVLKSLAMISLKESIKDKLKYWVEDYTLGGGYLQGKLPSPAEGIFIPEVVPGGFVKKDSLWGNIVDVINNVSTEVISSEEGIVLFLRDSAFVKEGDSLGGILPVSESGKLIINGK